MKRITTNVTSSVRYTALDDYKYRYTASDFLQPIINLTLYWGKNKWKEPRSIKRMSDMSPISGKIMRLFQDYKVNLISMRTIPKKDLEQMDSDLKYVLGLMKCAGSRRKYESYIMAHQEYFRHIPRSAADVLDVCMNIRDVSKYFVYTQGKEEEEADMCKALEDIKKHAAKQGEKRGEKRGVERVNQLIQMLSKDGRYDDIVRSATDSVFQQGLFMEYGI